MDASGTRFFVGGGHNNLATGYYILGMFNTATSTYRYVRKTFKYGYVMSRIRLIEDSTSITYHACLSYFDNPTFFIGSV